MKVSKEFYNDTVDFEIELIKLIRKRHKESIDEHIEELTIGGEGTDGTLRGIINQ